jgi:hypothetical protein
MTLTSLVLRLGHGHSTYDLPVLPAPEPRVCDTQSIRRTPTVLVKPAERYPIACESHVPSDLNRGRLKFNSLERQARACLRGNPVGDVIFTDR